MKIIKATLVLAAVCFCTTAAAEEKSMLDSVTDAVGGTVNSVGEMVSDTGETITGKDANKARAEINANEKKALNRLLSSSKPAKTLYDQAYGYAVFDSRKISLMLTTGGGTGVVVNKGSGDRTYMHMATGGVGLGYGAQFFQVVFLFENAASMNAFINSGWEGNAAATAMFGEDSLETNARFVEGMAVYQLNEAGVMADMNLTGTKYWKSNELNSVG